MMKDWFFGLREGTPQDLAGCGLKPTLSAPNAMADLTIELIFSHLNSSARPEFHIAPMRRGVHGPALFGFVVHPDLQYPFAVYLLSEDLMNYKVVSVLHQSFEGFDDAVVGSHETSVLRMRAHDLSFHREIHIGNDLQHGLFRVTRKAGLEDLMALLRTYVERTLILASDHGGGDATG
jgi:hypothetical protein